MRHSELAQVLRAANPWWSRRTRVSWAADDVHLAQRARHEWVTGSLAGRGALSEVAHAPGGTATVLVGPRAVGKTTAAKDAVLQALAEPELDPRAVVWVPVEATPGDPYPDRPPLDAQDLENALRQVHVLRRPGDARAAGPSRVGGAQHLGQLAVSHPPEGATRQ